MFHINDLPASFTATYFTYSARVTHDDDLSRKTDLTQVRRYAHIRITNKKKTINNRQQRLLIKYERRLKIQTINDRIQFTTDNQDLRLSYYHPSIHQKNPGL